MMKLLVLCLLDFLLASTANAATIRQYHEAKTAGGVQWRDMELHLSGTLDGIDAVNADLALRTKAPLYCQPSGLSLNVDNLVVIIDKALAALDSRLTEDDIVEAALLYGLKNTFPCK